MDCWTEELAVRRRSQKLQIKCIEIRVTTVRYRYAVKSVVVERRRQCEVEGTRKGHDR